MSKFDLRSYIFRLLKRYLKMFNKIVYPSLILMSLLFSGCASLPDREKSVQSWWVGEADCRWDIIVIIGLIEDGDKVAALFDEMILNKSVSHRFNSVLLEGRATGNIIKLKTDELRSRSSYIYNKKIEISLIKSKNGLEAEIIDRRRSCDKFKLKPFDWGIVGVAAPNSFEHLKAEMPRLWGWYDILHARLIESKVSRIKSEFSKSHDLLLNLPVELASIAKATEIKNDALGYTFFKNSVVRKEGQRLIGEYSGKYTVAIEELKKQIIKTEISAVAKPQINHEGNTLITAADLEVYKENNKALMGKLTPYFEKEELNEIRSLIRGEEKSLYKEVYLALIKTHPPMFDSIEGYITTRFAYDSFIKKNKPILNAHYNNKYSWYLNKKMDEYASNVASQDIKNWLIRNISNDKKGLRKIQNIWDEKYQKKDGSYWRNNFIYSNWQTNPYSLRQVNYMLREKYNAIRKEECMGVKGFETVGKVLCGNI